MTDKYILDDQGNPMPEPDLHKWARWFEQGEFRIVAKTQVGKYSVSTVFLGNPVRVPSINIQFI